jgi:hypothetical protein
VKTASAVGLLLLGLVQLGSAQIHGLGFVQGKVVDDKGVAIAGVTFTAVLPRVGGRIVGTSNEKGEWRIIGMAHGEWDLAFEKPGYATSRAKVILEPELARIPPMAVKLKTMKAAQGGGGATAP